jgi:hypothetical protein
MVRIEETPNFAADAVQYITRQGLLPTELTSQLESLTRDSRSLISLDDEIYGLRAGPLVAPRGGSEYVLAIEHRNARNVLIVLVAILNTPLAKIQLGAMDQMMKRKINIAVAL